MDEFEKLLAEVSSGVERFVRYRLPSQTDADDVLQEVYLSAYRNFAGLKNKAAFKPWIISIARNKCNDYFRVKAAQMEISIEELSQQELSAGRLGISVVHTVRETLDRLGDKDKQILYLYFWKELPQNEIAKLLDIPVGTVKSRLHTAKQHFKNKYPYQTQKPKGDTTMQKLPEYIPDYTIERLDAEPFSVRWEELQGWLIVPRVGQKLTWGMSASPSTAKPTSIGTIVFRITSSNEKTGQESKRRFLAYFHSASSCASRTPTCTPWMKPERSWSRQRVQTGYTI